jgi:hypothetical protein
MKHRTAPWSILSPLFKNAKEPPLGMTLDLGMTFWDLLFVLGGPECFLMVPLGAGAPPVFL